MENKRILTIVVMYNALRKNWAERCLNSLLKSAISTDIIVVDNASTDGTVALIKKKFQDVELIESNINLGFGQANNIGLKKCLLENYDYAFLLNQDAWIDENVIHGLIAISQLNPDFGILSPIHLNGEGTLLDKNFEAALPIIGGRELVSDALKGNYEKTVYPVQSVNAACWLITSSCIKTIGYFDPLFFHYGEDINYCQRVKFHGMCVGLIPNLFIYHDREDKLMQVFEGKKSFPWQKDDSQLKIKYADINQDLIENFFSLIKQEKKNLLKKILLCDFEATKLSIWRIKKLRNLLPEIIASRSRNKNSAKDHCNPLDK